MKLKHLLPALFSATLLFSSTSGVKAQDYKNAVGVGLEFGYGQAFGGPTYKHFFNARSAFQGEVLLTGGGAMMQAFYQYHLPIKNASGLRVYFGGGPGLYVVPGLASFFSLRPMAGLDYKVKQTPLTLNLDWRPVLLVEDDFSDFEPKKFGLGLKYSF